MVSKPHTGSRINQQETKKTHTHCSYDEILENKKQNSYHQNQIKMMQSANKSQ